MTTLKNAQHYSQQQTESQNNKSRIMHFLQVLVFFSNHFLRKHVCTLHEIPVMFVPLLEMLKTSWISSKTTKHLTDYKKAYSCWFNVKKKKIRRNENFARAGL